MRSGRSGNALQETPMQIGDEQRRSSGIPGGSEEKISRAGSHKIAPIAERDLDKAASREEQRVPGGTGEGDRAIRRCQPRWITDVRDGIGMDDPLWRQLDKRSIWVGGCWRTAGFGGQEKMVGERIEPDIVEPTDALSRGERHLLQDLQRPGAQERDKRIRRCRIDDGQHLVFAVPGHGVGAPRSPKPHFLYKLRMCRRLDIKDLDGPIAVRHGDLLLLSNAKHMVGAVVIDAHGTQASKSMDETNFFPCGQIKNMHGSVCRIRLIKTVGQLVNISSIKPPTDARSW